MSVGQGGVAATHDKAGVDYWNEVWDAGAKPEYRPGAPENVALTALLAAWLAAIPQGGTVLEVGCADSVILPYIHALGYETIGMDYSQVGCDKFTAQSPASRVICADMFDPPGDLVGAVDAVISLGLVEHFDDTASAVAALGRFLKPGGCMLTVIPNMRGSVGLLQRLLNRAAYDVHVPLSPGELAAAHAATLGEVRGGYLSAIGYGVVNHGYRPLPRAVVGVLARLSNLVARVDARTALPRTRAFSPHCYCLASRSR